jgi:hypothetical protein
MLVPNFGMQYDSFIKFIFQYIRLSMPFSAKQIIHMSGKIYQPPDNDVIIYIISRLHI